MPLQTALLRIYRLVDYIRDDFTGIQQQALGRVYTVSQGTARHPPVR